MIIKNGTIITWDTPNQLLKGKAILIQNGLVQDIQDEKLLLDRFPQEEILDADGQFIMPGIICAHTHFYGTFSRGMAIPGPAPKDFPEILNKLWWPLDKALNYEDIKYSALVCLIDAIKHGTTTLIDHHASQSNIEGSLDAIQDAVLAAGLRCCLCYEVTDRDGIDKTQLGIQENLRFINKIRIAKEQAGKISALFGLHASLTLSDHTLEKCRNLVPDGIGFHIHAAEHFCDQDDSILKSGLRVIDRLQKHEILGPKTIVAHAVHIDAREIQILSETGTWVTHQPRSNMNNGVGVSNIESMARAGVNLALGNDGFSNAMWDEWRTAYLVQKLHHLDPRRMPGDFVINLGVYKNAELAENIFPEIKLGKIVPGAVADLIFVDYHPVTDLSTDNLPWHILFGFRDGMVTTTIAEGKILMRDRKIIGLDEKEISKKAMELANKVWERYLSFVK